MTQSTNNDLQRSLGRLEGSQEAMDSRMGKLEKTVEDGFQSISNKLDRIGSRIETIEAVEAQRTGAWKVIVPVVTILSSIVTWLVGRFLG